MYQMKKLLILLFAFNVNATEIPRDPDGSITRSRQTLTAFQKAFPCPATNLPKGSCPGFIKDHVRPLCSGGRDVVSNLKWSEELYAKRRDKDEWELCNSLKRKYGEISLDEPKQHLCDIITSENLILIKDICK
jgi:hypothetical protein